MILIRITNRFTMIYSHILFSGLLAGQTAGELGFRAPSNRFRSSAVTVRHSKLSVEAERWLASKSSKASQGQKALGKGS